MRFNRKPTLLSLVFLSSFAIRGCAQDLSSGTAGGGVTPSFSRATTSGEIAIQNLDAEIEALRTTLLDRRPTAVLTPRYVRLLLHRAHVLGTFSDFDVALGEANNFVAESGQHEAWTLRAEVLTALHRFAEALEDLQKAQELGAEVDQQVHTVLLAQGLGDTNIVAARQGIAVEYPSYTSFTSLALAHAAMSEFPEAAQAYDTALDHYHDISPFPVAITSFQLGVLWAERADRPELGPAFYTEAIRRLPAYAVARVHEAEFYLEDDPERAIASFRALTRTEDPEVFGKLGQAYLNAGNEAEGLRWIERAHGRYQELLAKHRLAFADHGCEFYLGPGNDPELALQLALENLDNRKTARAYDLVARATAAVER